MTKDEAKTKWCPMVRYCIGNDDQNAANRWPDFQGQTLCNCIASDCMMWRSTDNECKSQYPGDPKAKSKPAGYCGLGGKP